MQNDLRSEQQGPGQAELLLFFAILTAYAVAIPLSTGLLRPGLLPYDEEGQLDLLQYYREGGPMLWRFGGGGLHRALLYLITLIAGPDLTLLRLPTLLAVLLEPALLYAWLKPRLGARAALWAGLADLVCTATFARARGMMAVGWTPSIFLIHACLLDRLRSSLALGLWGASVALWCLDYEGWAGAVLILGSMAALRFRNEPRRWVPAALGLLCALALVLSSGAGWGRYWETRSGISLDQGSWSRYLGPNLRSLLLGGDRIPLSAAPFQPYPPLWIWLPFALGAWPAIKRSPGLLLLLTIGSVPLILRLTDAEPHRLILAQLGIAACAGAGAAMLWERRPWSRWALLLLLLFGLISEGLAWRRWEPKRMQQDYGRSQALMRACAWLKAHPVPGGWEPLYGLGLQEDRAFAFLLDSAKVPRHGSVPVALVPWDYAPGLKHLKGELVELKGSDERGFLLAFPKDASVVYLRGARDQLAAFRRANHDLQPGELRRRCLEALDQGQLKGPWARTVAWETWMTVNAQFSSIDSAAFNRALKEPLVSAWFYDAAAESLQGRDPGKMARLLALSDRLDPRRRGLRDRFWHD